MSTKFFFRICVSYVPKNKLEKALIEHMLKLDHTLLEGVADKNTFVKELEQAVAALNLQHPRCRPAELHGWFTKSDKIKRLGIYGVVEGELYEVVHDKTRKCL